MHFRVLLLLCLFSGMESSLGLQAQAPETAPSAATFVSQGKAIAYEVFENKTAAATLILLCGTNGPDEPLSRVEGSFFAAHGYRVLLPHYLSATATADPTAANFRRWAEVVEDLVTNLRAHPNLQNKKIAVLGYSMGASVALIAGSRKLTVDAIAEWYGFLPDDFFAEVRGMAPLLILDMAQDHKVPVFNARQLIRLCKLRDFTCEAKFYTGGQDIFLESEVADANQRTLVFFDSHMHG